MLIAGALLVTAAALLAGTSGFGLGLLATPALLLAGFSLPFVVTINLLLSLATRIAVSRRLRGSVDRRRVALLVGGAAPGLWIGSWALGAVDRHDLRVAVGILVAGAALSLAFAGRAPSRPRVRGLTPAAGFAGGLLGTSTSLIGVPPALLLARRRLESRQFIADLSVYFVVTAALGLGVLLLEGRFSGDAARAFVWWLPGVLLANAVGTTAGLRLPAAGFRRLTLGLAFVAGVVTAATA